MIITQSVRMVNTVTTARKAVPVTMTTPCHVTLSTERAHVPKDGVEIDAKMTLMSVILTRVRITQNVSILKDHSTANVTLVISLPVMEFVKVIINDTKK
jgi:hypothetical protein